MGKVKVFHPHSKLLITSRPTCSQSRCLYRVSPHGWDFLLCRHPNLPDPPWRVGSQGAGGGGKAGRLHSPPGRAEICMQKKRSWRDGKENRQPKRLRQPEEQGRGGGWCIPHRQEHSPRPRWVKLGKWGDFTWDKTPAGMGSEPSRVCRGKQAWREQREKGPGSIAGGQALSQYF